MEKEGVWALAAGLLCLPVYLWFAPTGITLADAGLLQLVCAANGIAHPPGYPLATLLCHPFMQLPLPGALAGNLFSIVFAVLTLVVLFSLIRLLALSRRESFFSALAFGLCQAFFAQSVVLEVYTLNTALFLLECYGIVRFLRGDGDRWLLLGVLSFGLGLANHWPLIVLSTAALLPFAFSGFARLRALAQNWRLLLACLLVLLLGLSPYLLILGKSNASMAMHGDIGSWPELFRYVSRTTYEDSFVAQQSRSLDYLWWLPVTSFKQFTLAGLLLIPIGMMRAAFELRRDVMLFLLLLWALNVLLLPVLSNYSFDETMRQYYVSWTLLALVSCAVWLVLGVRYLVSIVARNQRVIEGLTCAAVIVICAFSLQQHSKQDAAWVEEYNRLLLASLPRDAVLIVAGDGQTGPLGYLHHMQQVRPDIELRHEHNILFDNRLMSPFAATELQQQALHDFAQRTTRPVFQVSGLAGQAQDHGMFFQLNTAAGFVEHPELDEYMARLAQALAADDIRDSFIRFYLHAKYYEYARSVIGQAIVSEGINEAYQEKLLAVSATLAGKIWTLHHLVANGDQANKAQLLALVQAGEAQISRRTIERAAGHFYRLAGDAFLMVPADAASAIERFRRAQAFDVLSETCDHLESKHGPELSALMHCRSG